MLFLLVSLLVLLVHVASAQSIQPTRPIFFEDLPQCARYSYLESAKDSPCHGSRDRYCLCAGSELDKVLAATYSRAVMFCEPKASETTALIADWLDFVCDPKLAHYRQRRRSIPAPAVVLANKTDESVPDVNKPKKQGSTRGRRFKRGGIVGIAVAAIVGVGILGAAVFFCFTTWRNR